MPQLWSNPRALVKCSNQIIWDQISSLIRCSKIKQILISLLQPPIILLNHAQELPKPLMMRPKAFNQHCFAACFAWNQPGREMCFYSHRTCHLLRWKLWLLGGCWASNEHLMPQHRLLPSSVALRWSTKVVQACLGGRICYCSLLNQDLEIPTTITTTTTRRLPCCQLHPLPRFQSLISHRPPQSTPYSAPHLLTLAWSWSPSRHS